MGHRVPLCLLPVRLHGAGTGADHAVPDPGAPGRPVQAGPQAVADHAEAQRADAEERRGQWAEGALEARQGAYQPRQAGASAARRAPFDHPAERDDARERHRRASGNDPRHGQRHGRAVIPALHGGNPPHGGAAESDESASAHSGRLRRDHQVPSGVTREGGGCRGNHARAWGVRHYSGHPGAERHPAVDP